MSRPEQYYSVDEYLAMEATAEVRHEYLHGTIVAMPGGTLDHNQIALNLQRAFDPVRERGCRAYVIDVRVTMPSGLYTYPDVVAICGLPAEVPGKWTTVTNPIVIAEVLSPDTTVYDRGKKFELYKSIPTFRDYLLIDQYNIDVEHRWRDGDRWQSAHFKKSDSFTLTGIPLTILVDALYEDVTIPA
jgi:Uma2 family endonuclease